MDATGSGEPGEVRSLRVYLRVESGESVSSL